jgi:formate--tetrahydrofolate ligase
MLTDIEIAQNTKMKPITQIADSIGIGAGSLELYGDYKAKVKSSAIAGMEKDGNLILVTAITPTPAGEGKTTTSIGLADALRKIGKKSMLALREPSLGPVFGVKGGAAGGGYAQVIPMEDINLHFTGDIHAVTAANNLLAALIDNHIYQGNELNIDVRRITWKRCLDMNDRQLRYTVDGLGGKSNGMPREDGFDITVASEIMAILCLSNSIDDMKERIGRIIIGYDHSGEPVTAAMLKAEGSLTVLLKDALKPNLVQTLEGTPAFVHGGPFANIAHGCNSVMATRYALKLADYVVTEAGFGADLGAEKFFDIKCRMADLHPKAVVIVATVKALKYHGGVNKKDLGETNVQAVELGMPNLYKHIENMTQVFKIPAVVSINKFSKDTQEELDVIKKGCASIGVKAVECLVWEKGGEGGKELAEEVVRLCDQPNGFTFCYESSLSTLDKLNAIATKIYGALGVELSSDAKAVLKVIKEKGYSRLPVCVAKTQFSFSDNVKLIGRPAGFTVVVRDLKISAGAGFIVALTGEIMTMPGLPKVPAAMSIDIDNAGKISGLF